MLDIKTLQSDNREDLIKEISLMFNKGYILFGGENEVYDDEDEYGNEIYDSEFKYFEQSVILPSGQKVIKNDDWEINGFVEIHNLSNDDNLIKEFHQFSHGGIKKSLIFKKENDAFILFKKIIYWLKKVNCKRQHPQYIWEGTFELVSYDDYYKGQGYNDTMKEHPDYPIKAEYLIDGIETHYWVRSDEIYNGSLLEILFFVLNP
jgi:hypothetical protein